MKQILRFNFDIIMDSASEKSKEELLETARKMMFEDGMAEYINEDNATVLSSDADRPFKARTVYGSELISALEDIQSEEEDDDENPDNAGSKKEKYLENAIRRVINDNNGELRQRSFKTQAEVDAYYLGQIDQDGWSHCEPGDNFGCIPDSVWDEEERINQND